MEKLTICLLKKPNASDCQNPCYLAQRFLSTLVSPCFRGAGVEGSSASPPARGFVCLALLGSACSRLRCPSPGMRSWPPGCSAVCLESREQSCTGGGEGDPGLLSGCQRWGIQTRRLAQKGESHT